MLHIFLEADGMLKDVPLDNIIHTQEPIYVGALPHGMQSGRPSVAFAVKLPDGSYIFAETSMRLFLMAAKAFAAKYGWQDDEGQNRS